MGGVQWGFVQRPDDIPEKSDEQREAVGSVELKKQLAQVSYTARKRPKSLMKKPYEL